MSGEQHQHQHRKKKEDEIDEQKNKSHRSLNKKLKKRRKHEKEVLKDKKQKKKDYSDKRDAYREQYFAQSKKPKSKKDKDSKGIKIYKLQSTLKKFLKIYEDDIEDFKSIFSSLDEGEEIEIQDIENPKIRKYLTKILKYLKAKQRSGKLGYRKTSKTDFSLSTYMNNIINDCLLSTNKKDESDSDNDNQSDEDQQKDDSDSSSDEDEDNHKKGKEPSKKLKKNSDDDEDDDDDDSDISDNDDNDNKKKDQVAKQQPKVLGPQMPSLIGPMVPSQIGPAVPSSVGPSLISQEEKQKFLQSALSEEPKQSSNNWMIAGDLDSFLDESFKEVESSNVKKFLQNKRVNDTKRPVGPSLDSSRLAPGSAPIDLESVQIDDSEARQSAAEYESKYRNKSLMEIHQENLKKKKQEQGKDTFRKPFDRNEDLVIKKTDSKKLFAALQESFQHGPKFQPAKN